MNRSGRTVKNVFAICFQTQYILHCLNNVETSKLKLNFTTRFDLWNIIT